MKLLTQASRLAFLLAALLATPGFGQFLPVALGVSLEAQDFFTGSRGGSRASVAALPNGGGFATVWNRASPDLSSNDVYLQFVRADGSLVFERSGRAVAVSPASETDAVVAAHAREGALVGWRTYSRGLNSSQMMFQWFDGRGRPRWGAGVAAAPTPSGESQGTSALLASPDGGAFVCFINTITGTTIVNTIDCQRFSPKGKRLWGKSGVRVFTWDQHIEGPHLVPDGAGGVLVFWRSGVGNGPGSIRGQRLSSKGRLLWGGGVEGRVFHETRSPESAYPREIGVISDGGGGALVAFDDFISEADVTVLRVSGAGEALWGNGITVPGSDSQTLNALASGPDGGFFVGVYAGSSHAVAFHRFTADGTPLWPTEGVPVVDPSTVSPGDVHWLAFAVFAGNELHFAWEHIPDTIYPEIRFGALDLAGNRLTGPAGAPLTEEPAVSHTLGGLAFNPESGVSFVIWHASRSHGEFGDADAQGAIYDSP